MRLDIIQLRMRDAQPNKVLDSSSNDPWTFRVLLLDVCRAFGWPARQLRVIGVLPLEGNIRVPHGEGQYFS